MRASARSKLVFSMIAVATISCGCTPAPAPTRPNDSAPIIGKSSGAPSASASIVAASASAPPAAPPAAPAPVRPPTVEWARRWGSYGSENAGRLVVADDGTWIMAGGYQFEIDFDGKKLRGSSALQGNMGTFIAGFAPDGKPRWATDFHGRANENITDMALGPDGTVVFTGAFREMNAGCGKIRSVEFDDILVGALSTLGRCEWTRGFGSKGNDWGQSIAVDGAGNVIVFGTFQSGTSFGGGPMDVGESAGVFAASFTPGGKYRWARSLGNRSPIFAQDATVDAAGNVYVALRFEGTVDFGDGPKTGRGGGDVALLALSSDGRLSWSTSFGGPALDVVNGLVVDPRSGDLLLVGSFARFIDIGTHHLASAGGGEGFIARFDKTGKPLWAQRLGSSEHDSLGSVALDALGNIYAIGQFRGSFTFGESTLRSAGEYDALAVSMNPDGSPRWAMSFGGPGYEDANGLAVEPSGRILVAGTFASKASFGTINLESAGAHDIFAIAMRP